MAADGDGSTWRGRSALLLSPVTLLLNLIIHFQFSPPQEASSCTSYEGAITKEKFPLAARSAEGTSFGLALPFVFPRVRPTIVQYVYSQHCPLVDLHSSYTLFSLFFFSFSAITSCIPFESSLSPTQELIVSFNPIFLLSQATVPLSSHQPHFSLCREAFSTKYERST